MKDVIELAIIHDPEPIKVMDTGCKFRNRRVFLETNDICDTRRFSQWARNLYRDILGLDQV